MDGSGGTSTGDGEISNVGYSFREVGVGATFTRLQAWESLAKPSAHGVFGGGGRGNKKSKSLGMEQVCREANDEQVNMSD